MAGQIIDCCSLLNLYAGWGGLTELTGLHEAWHICDTVLNETEYTREYGPDGTLLMAPLDLDALTRPGLLVAVRPETEEEIEDYVDFASEVDDGEAQALAVAKHRRLVLLTDDRKAVKISIRPDVAVRTISTPEVLQIWSQLNAANGKRLREVIMRITVLARFHPNINSPGYAWWRDILSETSEPE